MDYKSGGTPKTIDELKDYCARNGITSDKNRFFIGSNYKKPKAIGIYKDEATGKFVVYKNMEAGNRLVRYRGTDEAFAVSELYDKVEKEISYQKLQSVADMAVRDRKKHTDRLSFGEPDEEEYKSKSVPQLDRKTDEDDSAGSGLSTFVAAALFGWIMALAFGDEISTYYYNHSLEIFILTVLWAESFHYLNRRSDSYYSIVCKAVSFILTLLFVKIICFLSGDESNAFITAIYLLLESFGFIVPYLDRILDNGNSKVSITARFLVMALFVIILCYFCDSLFYSYNIKFNFSPVCLRLSVLLGLFISIHSDYSGYDSYDSGNTNQSSDW